MNNKLLASECRLVISMTETGKNKLGHSIVDILPQNETKEAEEVRTGERGMKEKWKVRYLIQKREVPVRKEALSYVEQLRARALKNTAYVAKNTGQTLSVHPKGTVFDEGNREENFGNNWGTDADQAKINRINAASIEAIVGTATNEKPKPSLGDKYNFGDEQYFIKIQNLVLPGNVASMHEFEDAKFDFGQFLDGIRDTILANTKTRIRLYPQYGRRMRDNVFNGIVTFYFDDESHAQLARKELDGAIYNNYEIHVDPVEKKVKLDTMKPGIGF